jgi:hypothetical protein
MQVIYCLVEGESDAQFLDYLNNFCATHGGEVVLRSIPYANRGHLEFVKKKVKSLRHSKVKFLLLKDLDSAPCLVDKVTAIVGEINDLTPKDVVIVVKQIESWFLAGVQDTDPLFQWCTPSQRSKLASPETVDKNFFLTLVKRKKDLFSNEVLLRAYCLENYDINTALNRSPSLKRFCGLLGV